MKKRYGDSSRVGPIEQKVLDILDSHIPDKRKLDRIWRIITTIPHQDLRIEIRIKLSKKLKALSLRVVQKLESEGLQ